MLIYHTLIFSYPLPAIFLMASPPSLTIDFLPELPPLFDDPSSLLEECLLDLESTANLAVPLDFTLSSTDSWQESLRHHLNSLRSTKGPYSILLYHSYLIGKLLHEEELRMLGRLTPTLTRSRKNGRRLHLLFKNTIGRLGASMDHYYYSARRVFALYSTRDPQMIQFAQNISPARLRLLPKQDYIQLYRKAREVSQPSSTYPYHLSVFIGTIEL